MENLAKNILPGVGSRLKTELILIIFSVTLVGCKSYFSKKPIKETTKISAKAKKLKKKDNSFDLDLMSGEVSSHQTICEITLPKNCKRKFSNNRTVSRFVTSQRQCKVEAYKKYSNCRNNVKNPNVLVNYTFYETDGTTNAVNIKDGGTTSKVCFLSEYKCASRPKRKFDKRLITGFDDQKSCKKSIIRLSKRRCHGRVDIAYGYFVNHDREVLTNIKYNP